jgi:DNA-binding MarR family transcriptional regulator
MGAAGMPGSLDCHATALRKASRRLTQLYDGALAPSGLRSTQFAILAELIDQGQGRLTLGELADLLVLDRSGLGHSLRPLERDGLLRLEENATDRRSKHIVLTERGRQRYQDASDLWQTAQDQYASAIGESDAVDLRQRLLTIAQSQDLS